MVHNPAWKIQISKILDAKLYTFIGVIYSSATTDTYSKNFSLDDSQKVLSKNISQLVIDGIFRAELDNNEVFIIDEYIYHPNLVQAEALSAPHLMTSVRHQRLVPQPTGGVAAQSSSIPQ